MALVITWEILWHLPIIIYIGWSSALQHWKYMYVHTQCIYKLVCHFWLIVEHTRYFRWFGAVWNEHTPTKLFMSWICQFVTWLCFFCKSFVYLYMYENTILLKWCWFSHYCSSYYWWESHCMRDSTHDNYNSFWTIKYRHMYNYCNFNMQRYICTKLQ